MTESIFQDASHDPVADRQAIDTILKHMKFARGYTMSLLKGLSEDDWFLQPAEGITHIAWHGFPNGMCPFASSTICLRQGF